ncbi:MAG TPA: GldG family protein [Elusimicrobiota bacterium]|nr:GldG family protein [Elusimicrobiota bacterium]
MSGRLRRTAEAALVAGCLALANLVGARLYLRADLSAGGIYSLSDGSKRILAALPGPVEVRAYFSKELPPEYAAARAYARDLLREYRSASGGRLRFRVYEGSDPAARQEAYRQGIAPLQFNVVSRDKYEVREGFMGMVVQYADKKEVLPVLSQPEGLEYDLTSRIRLLTAASRPKLALVSSHGAIGPDELHPQVREYLERNYQLVPLRLDALAPGTTVAADVSALLLLGPSERLDSKALFALDQFLMSGRPAALALDGRQADPRSFLVSDLDVGLGGLLKRYGVTLRPNFVLDAQCQKLAVESRRGWLTLQNVVDYPPFVLATDLDPGHPVTRHAQALPLPFVCPLDVPPGAKVLARSSRMSWQRAAWARGSFSANPMQSMAPAPADPKGPFVLAAALDGPFQSFFSGAQAPGGPFSARSPAAARLLIVGTARFARPQMSGGGSGPVLLLNIADWLAQDPDLGAMRAKTAVFRPLIEIPAGGKALVRWLLVLLPPAAAAAFGALRLARRRRLRARRRERFAPPAPGTAAA